HPLGLDASARPDVRRSPAARCAAVHPRHPASSGATAILAGWPHIGSVLRRLTVDALAARPTAHDFTQGETLKQLVRFSAPIMLANLLQSSYQLADSLWIGNLLGAEALGAVVVSSVVIFTVLSFVIGMNNAAL